MDAVLLLVGRLVLLVDDDQTEIGIGQEQGRAGPDHHGRLARGDPGEQPVALPSRHPRVPGGGADAEARREAVEELGRQRDLGH
jgi:hypothetical protein